MKYQSDRFWRLYCPRCDVVYSAGQLTRFPIQLRTTFIDNDLRVENAGELLCYGPETARAYANVRPQREAILARRNEALTRLRPFYRQLRSLNADPHCWLAMADMACAETVDQAYPWHELARCGYDAIWNAAVADTDCWFTAADGGQAEPFRPCRSPREAYERYGVAA